MVRFSTVIFWLSFISETASVGTTTWRTARCWPSETIRCSRFCLTLFSCPEYVLTTYQRNMTVFLDDCVDDLAGDVVGDAEEDAGDDDEAEYNAGGLRDLLAIRPLDPLQLGPARPQEGDDAVAGGPALGRLGSGAERGARRVHVAALVTIVAECDRRLVLDRRLGGVALARERASGPRRGAAGPIALAVTRHDTAS